MSGWLPWAALVAGTAASLAANVAAADADVIGRVVAGWPTFALLVAVKLCSRLLEPRRGGDARPATAALSTAAGACPPPRRGGDARPATAARRPVGAVTHPRPDAGPGGGPPVVPARVQPPGPRVAGGARPDQPEPACGGAVGTALAATQARRDATGGDGDDVAGLLPAARAAAGRVMARGGTLTRDGLAAQLRRDGFPVRNATVSQLLTTLRGEPVIPAPAAAGLGD